MVPEMAIRLLKRTTVETVVLLNPLVSEAYLETVWRTIEAAKKLVVLRDRYGDRSQPLSLNMHMNHGIYITLPDRKVQMYDRDFDTYMKSFAFSCPRWL